MRRAVFLDRDGVLNRTEVRDGKPYAPRRLEDFRLLPGVAAATKRLKDAGFFLAVVTNQPDIGNGHVTAAVVDEMHRRLRARLPVDAIYTCPHRQQQGCDCRKPKPGMLLAAAAQHGLNLGASFMVGDRMTDVLAGDAAGCYTVLVSRKSGYPESRGFEVTPKARATSFPNAVQIILGQLSAE